MEINKEELRTYKQKLDFIEQLFKNQMTLTGFSIASDMEAALDCEEIEYTDEQFEKYCSIAENAYLDAEEMTCWAMCRAVADIIKEDGEEELLNMDKWNLINKASYFL